MTDNKNLEDNIEEVLEERTEDIEDVQEGNVEDLHEEVEEENVAQEGEMDSLKNNLLRLQADFINYKRRTEQERKDYIELGTKKVLMDLLNIIDNFERALGSETEDRKYKEGVELIYKQMIDLLGRNNVKEMQTENIKFDPNLHHAVLVEEKEGVEEGMIIDVLQKGYLIGEKVLRPAMVKVSK
ncbi:MAG: nucleotide exchange factor GrpE [Peptoniphilus sp.]|nr:nucleotide exchange factor GrpE [Peptoniphilus sp.]